MNRLRPRVTDLIPFVHVADLPRSIAFYELLGLEVADTYEVDGALRDHLVARGLPVGPIRDGRPGPEREIRLSDPDGYCLAAP